jgi:hypothetical protein
MVRFRTYIVLKWQSDKRERSIRKIGWSERMVGG